MKRTTCERPDCDSVPSSTRRFCSQRCIAIHYNTTSPNRPRATYGNCLYCGEKLTVRRNQYCSQSHNKEHKHELFMQAWLAGDLSKVSQSDGSMTSAVPYNLLKYRGAKCEVCGWNEIHPVTGRVPVQIDHVDGDVTNNSFSNLMILCPNHHALTPTYGYLNSNSSRARRGLPPLPREYSRPKRIAKLHEKELGPLADR